MIYHGRTLLLKEDMEKNIMEHKDRYLTLIVVLLSIILALLIRLDYPLKVSTTESIFHMIPIHYWIFLIAIPVLISVTFLLTKSKMICVFLAMIYFFILYSFYLFFVIPPAGTDMVGAEQTLSTLKNTNFFSVEQFDYFQWPIHFILNIIYIKLFNIGLSIFSLTLFSFILMMPIFFYLVGGKQSNEKIYFLLPVGYMIFSYYFINLQLVPQFTGLIFLILTIGCYTKYRETKSIRFYALVLLFYTLCVFTHPFIFVFFPAAIFLDNYVLPKKIIKSKNKTNKKFFLILLFVIYFTGYMYRFTRMGVYTRRIFLGSRENMGESWNIIAYLMGDKQEVGLIDYDVFPLYNLLSNDIYLFFRYATFLLLLIFALILAYLFFKNLKEIKPFDVSLGLAGVSFFLLGFIEPYLMGQRAFQIIFLKVPRFFSTLFKSKKTILVFVLVLCITITPLIFTANTAIRHSLSGGRQIQDVTTINSGRFIMDFVRTKSNILIAGISFYPARYNELYNLSTIKDIIEGMVNITEINMIVNSPKQMNRMKYYGLILDYSQTYQVFDNGDSQILIYDS